MGATGNASCPPHPEASLPPLPICLNRPDYIADWQARCTDALLPYWQRLAWGYWLALAMPDSDDAHWLPVVIDDWPNDLPEWRFDCFCGRLRAQESIGSDSIDY